MGKPTLDLETPTGSGGRKSVGSGGSDSQTRRGAKGVRAAGRIGRNKLTAERTILQERLLNIIKRFPQRRIIVVGDAIADQFIFGAISRVSREAPVLILRHENTETVPGGAANCAVNLASLGANVSL